MSPGKILTREELCEILNSTPENVDYLLDLCTSDDSPFLHVMNMLDDRLLVIDNSCWEEMLLLFSHIENGFRSIEVDSD